MKHINKQKKLNRTSNHRKALFMNLCREIVKHGRILTTVAKAKAIRPILEKYITLAKKNQSTHKLHTIFNGLDGIRKVAERCKDRNGGYLSIVKCGYRQGDNAPIAYIRVV